MAKFSEEIIAQIQKELGSSIPQLSINCVIFRFNGTALQIPVVQPIHADIWTIPGGFIRQLEDIDDAAKRILFEQTTLDNLLLSQFGTFGAAKREFRTEMDRFSESGIPKDLINWMSQRFVTIGYYSIVGREQTNLQTGHFFKQVKWINVTETRSLALDHGQLVSEALVSLRSELQSRPLIASFMPETFTIPQLQRLYEAILGRAVDRGNFRQSILKSKILHKMGPSKEKTGSRPPILYQLDKKKYLNSLTQDVKLGF
ncbi:MAG: NUDIX domain-containing protein [Flavobacteriaceae bacterium]